MEIKNYVGIIRRAAEYIRSRAPHITPEMAVILGSGLSKAVPALTDQETPNPHTTLASAGLPFATCTTTSAASTRLSAQRRP